MAQSYTVLHGLHSKMQFISAGERAKATQLRLGVYTNGILDEFVSFSRCAVEYQAGGLDDGSFGPALDTVFRKILSADR